MEDTYLDTLGFYEPNWFFMYVSGIPADLKLDFDRFSNKQNGLYLHEYGHYLQNITTLSGVLNAIEYYEFTHNIRVRSEKLDTINLPFTNKSIRSEYEQKRLNRFKLFRGDYYDVLGITDYDYFEVSTHYELETKGTRKLSFYKNSTLLKRYNFGNLAVKEGMSRALQIVFDKEPGHPFYPYKMVQCVVDKYCPKLSNNPIEIAALCSLALNFENAGHHFFRLVIDYNNADISMKEFIHQEFSRKLDISDGSGLTIKELLIQSIEKLRSTIHFLLGSKVKYIDSLFDNIIAIEKAHDLLFYDLLSDPNIPLVSKLNELKGYYGVPLIQLEDLTWIFPVADTPSGVAEELVELRTIKVLLDRLFEVEGRKECRYIPMCDMKQEFITDDCCYEKQWLRETICPLTQMLEYWKIRDQLSKS
ncbi:MAG: hypothetical protein K0S23_634 [Fluviicola sp.]|jgi:hypothetical protein|uniref:hypothetical protein n=1 Tax=Fluviicola sp. TaxID=1917219 RepID=UPI00260B18B1|nr:hypothetical protein [Fluviicola sp.]MDF3026327.1 hypothetical protein [Fluviicola sp.]